MRNGRFELNFLTLQGKPNTHAWSTEGSPQATFALPFRIVEQGHPPRVQSHALHSHVYTHLNFVQVG
jgi:hypothetical protein